MSRPNLRRRNQVSRQGGSQNTSQQSNSGSLGEKLYRGILELDKAAAWKEGEDCRLKKKYPLRLSTEEYENWQREKQAAKEQFDRRWIAALDHIRNLCGKIRQSQPHLVKLKPEHINQSGEFPGNIVFGSLDLSYANFNDSVPRFASFPLEQALWFSGEESERELVYQLLLRLLFALPVGRFELYTCDPLRGGKSPGSFLPLFNRKNLAPHCRVLTRSDEIETMLQNQLDYVEELRQKRFMNAETNWKTYNRKNGTMLPYRMLLLFDVPEQLTDKSLWYLSRLVELGPDCGVLPILAYKKDKTEDKKYTNLYECVNNNGKKIDAMLQEDGLAGRFQYLEVSEQGEAPPSLSLLEKMIAALSQAYADAADTNKPVDALWPPDEFWKANTTEGLNVPIGWDNRGEAVFFSIGGTGTAQHVLIGGATNSGKSNLMHVIIHSLCHYYSPEEFCVYLLDYKLGQESMVYTEPLLPHAALIAVESDPEYGAAVLKHLVEEKERRARLFKDAGSNTVDFRRYREQGKKLSRILLIVDEFQGLYQGSRETTEKADRCLIDLLRQGRSFGIHVLLATQSLTGIQDFFSSRQLTGQIGCRIALACAPDDSGKLLGNNGAAELDIQRHEAIINTSQGKAAGNIVFRAPKADASDAVCKAHSLRFEETARKQGSVNRTKIFNGVSLPAMPAGNSFVPPGCEEGDLYPLRLGESLSYEANVFIVNFHQSAASNLLIAGADKAMHDGMLLSVIVSLMTVNQNVKPEDRVTITYLWGKPGRKVPAFLDDYPEIIRVSNVEALELKTMAEGMRENRASRRVIIIDGIESVRKLQLESKPSDYDLKQKPDLPAYLLREILENGPPLGAVVIAFSENWSHCSQVCAALLKGFEQRVGFSLGEADAGKLLSGAGGDKLSFKGIESGKNCAVYLDRLMTRQELFRPYIIGHGGHIA